MGNMNSATANTNTVSTTITLKLTDEWKARALRSSWAMFEPEGGRMVAEAFIALLEGGVIIAERRGDLSYDFAREVFEAIDLIVSPVHSEVGDTEVRELIMGHAERLLGANE
jgi:hypothetical protein